MASQEGDISGRTSFAERLSPLIAAAGVVAVPVLLVRYQARLGLTANELVYLLHVLSHRWEASGWPWVVVASVCEASGASERSVREWKTSLQNKRMLRCSPRYVPGVGRRADEHDLSGLFAALEALILEEETRKALDQVRSDLPEPAYHRGLASTPQLSTGRPAISRHTEMRKVAPAPCENLHLGGAKSRSTEVREVAPEVETLTGEPGIRVQSGENQQEEPGLTNRALAAARPVYPQPELEQKSSAEPETDPGTEAAPGARRPLAEQVEEAPAASLEETVAVDPLVVALEATRADPGAWDEIIVGFIDEWAVELGDDDAGRSCQRAHRMWWNSGLDRDAFHRAMKRAWYATRSRQRQAAINGPPMAYLFGVLAGAIADERMKLGLPLSPGEVQTKPEAAPSASRSPAAAKPETGGRKRRVA